MIRQSGTKESGYCLRETVSNSWNQLIWLKGRQTKHHSWEHIFGNKSSKDYRLSNLWKSLNISEKLVYENFFFACWHWLYNSMHICHSWVWQTHLGFDLHICKQHQRSCVAGDGVWAYFEGRHSHFCKVALPLPLCPQSHPTHRWDKVITCTRSARGDTAYWVRVSRRQGMQSKEPQCRSASWQGPSNSLDYSGELYIISKYSYE